MLTRAAGAVPAVLAVLALAACVPGTGATGTAPTSAPVATASSPTPDAAPATPAQAATPPGGAFTFAVVGDSLTVGDSPAFEEGLVGDLSWVAYAQGEGVEFVGGTAVVGATSWAQLERARTLPQEVFDADVLVMALGTNDMSAGLGVEPTVEALTGIAELFDPERVLVLAVPPRTVEIEPSTVEFNAFLQDLAAEHDWQYVDAAAAVREGDGWAEGMTGDGIHYTRAAIPLVGQRVGAALRDVP